MRPVAFLLYRAQCKDLGLPAAVREPLLQSVDINLSSSDGFNSLPTPRHSGGDVAAGMRSLDLQPLLVFSNSVPRRWRKSAYLAVVAGKLRDIS